MPFGAPAAPRSQRLRSLPGPPVIIDDINGGHVAEVAAAVIDVNDAHVADLAPGQTYVGGVPPGPTSVTTTGTAEPGHYTVRFDAVGGKTYAFQVSPRTDATRRVAMMTGLAGYVIEATAKGETGGPFKITPVAP